MAVQAVGTSCADASKTNLHHASLQDSGNRIWSFDQRPPRGSRRMSLVEIRLSTGKSFGQELFEPVVTGVLFFKITSAETNTHET